MVLKAIPGLIHSQIAHLIRSRADPMFLSPVPIPLSDSASLEDMIVAMVRSHAIHVLEIPVSPVRPVILARTEISGRLETLATTGTTGKYVTSVIPELLSPLGRIGHAITRNAEARTTAVNQRGLICPLVAMSMSGSDLETPAVPATAADAPEPHINPERAALLAKDSERARAPDSDRPGRSRKSAPNEPMEGVNPERAALMENRDSTPSRPPRDEGRERSSRGHSPRRGTRYGHESGPPEGGRDDRHDRNYPVDHRTSGRDPRERSPMPSNYRGERPVDREAAERAPPNKGRDASGFHGSSSRGPEPEYKPPHQDETYGRLNPIQNVADIPYGPRGRGRSSARGGHGGPQALPGRMDNRFAGPEAERPPTPDRAPPTGPSSGRGRRGGYEQNTGPVTPSSTPGSGPQGRARNAGPGQGIPSPASTNATPSGVHPERLAQIGNSLPPPPPPGPPPHGHGHSHGHGRQPMPATNTPDRNPAPGPRQPSGNYSGSPAGESSVPTGPASSNERSRNGGGRRQLAGINSTLQQAQANMPEMNRNGSVRRNQPRQMLGNSDAQTLSGMNRRAEGLPTGMNRLVVASMSEAVAIGKVVQTVPRAEVAVSESENENELLVENARARSTASTETAVQELAKVAGKSESRDAQRESRAIVDVSRWDPPAAAEI
ncbi:hypothetical protein ACJ41O_011139 [Fusarium nematophilum]